VLARLVSCFGSDSDIAGDVFRRVQAALALVVPGHRQAVLVSKQRRFRPQLWRGESRRTVQRRERRFGAALGRGSSCGQRKAAAFRRSGWKRATTAVGGRHRCFGSGTGSGQPRRSVEEASVSARVSEAGSHGGRWKRPAFRRGFRKRAATAVGGRVRRFGAGRGSGQPRRSVDVFGVSAQDAEAGSHRRCLCSMAFRRQAGDAVRRVWTRGASATARKGVSAAVYGQRALRCERL
jgi:hypothetical protein